MQPRPALGEVKVLDHGYVALVDTMGHDRTPAQTARTSFRNRVVRTPEEDAKLTDYLVRNRHTTPLEFCQVLFYMKMPIFVARQLVRHRTASINEVSYRYVQAAREYYVPAPERMQRQATSNKQGSSDETIDEPLMAQELMHQTCELAFDGYQALLAQGLAAEIARTVLPCGTYTEWYWQSDLHNFLNMLRLRLDAHAQYEIRVFARAMLELAYPHFPTIIQSWARASGIVIEVGE